MSGHRVVTLFSKAMGKHFGLRVVIVHDQDALPYFSWENVDFGCYHWVDWHAGSIFLTLKKGRVAKT
jgi:hypothetical protein